MGAHELFFDTQYDYFSNSLIKISPCRSPSKDSGFGTMLVMTTETTFLEDQVVNLTKLINRLSTSLEEKDQEITKLMNKLESMNERDQISVTKALQMDQLDVIEDSIIGAIRNIHGITDGFFTMNKLKELIKEAIMDQVESSVQPLYFYVKSYTQKINMLKMHLSYQPPKF